MEYYSAIKKNKIMPFVITWLDLEINILSEVRERLIYDIIYMWNLITILYKLTYVQNKNRFTGLKIKLFFFFLGLHTRHMEVSSLGIYTTATAAQDPSCVYKVHHSSQQCQILYLLRKAKD